MKKTLVALIASITLAITPQFAITAEQSSDKKSDDKATGPREGG